MGYPFGGLVERRNLDQQPGQQKQGRGQNEPAGWGEQQRLDDPTACIQSTPLVPPPERANSWFVMPTPMIEPISACELELGVPRYQVPKFQMIAAKRLTSAAPSDATAGP